MKKKRNVWFVKINLVFYTKIKQNVLPRKMMYLTVRK